MDTFACALMPNCCTCCSSCAPDPGYDFGHPMNLVELIELIQLASLMTLAYCLHMYDRVDRVVKYLSRLGTKPRQCQVYSGRGWGLMSQALVMNANLESFEHRATSNPLVDASMLPRDATVYRVVTCYRNAACSEGAV